MSLISQYLKAKEIFKSLSLSDKKNLFFLGCVLFCVLFSYPILRSTTTSLFLDAYGAKNSPLVWFYSIFALSISVTLYNKLQKKLSVHKLFLMTAIFSLLLFITGILLSQNGFRWSAYLLYIWKEVYIVLLIHLAFAFLNTSVSSEQAKIIFGPVGALGSIGGVLGGVLTSAMTLYFSTNTILVTGAFIVLASGLFFWFTDHTKCLSKMTSQKENKSTSPIDSVMNVKGYVFLIGSVICLSQFVINIANFKFNILFSEIVTDSTLKTRYLGNLYAGVNGLSLLIQLVFLPFIYQAFHIKNVHRFIPVLYTIVIFMGLTVGAGFLLPVSLAFMFLKGSDYSLFSTSKELLYTPLTASQKYGAKYINDMVIYRASKALISFVLIYYQEIEVLTYCLYIFLAYWFITLFPLFKRHERIEKRV